MTYPGREKMSHRVTRLGAVDDLPGGGQVVVQGNYAFVGHMDPPHGTSIIDVSDPRNPKVVSRLTLPDMASHTHKVRVVGDLMYVNVERYDRHFKHKATQIDPVKAAFKAETGREPTDAELAQKIGIKPERMGDLWAAYHEDYRDGGWKVYDIADKTNPREIAYVHTHGFGTHRFDVDENYAYMSTEMEGYVGNILVVYDMADPTKPREVSRFHIPGQHVAGGETPTWKGYRNRLHHGMRVGDEIWCSYWHAGIRVLDCTDITDLKLAGEYVFPPAIPEPTHTVMPLEQRINGRRYAVSVDEEHDFRHGSLHGFVWVMDVTDLQNMIPVGAFDVSERDSPYSRAGGRFGAHQFREKLDDTLVYLTWFSGGLRIIDLKDPTRPEEVAHFIPEPRKSFPSPQANDVTLDDRGLVYMIDRNAGLDIMEFDRP